MTISELGSIGELISAVAVVVSLVYLAIQLRQNTKVVRANAAWDSEIVYGTGNSEVGRDPASALLFSRAMNPIANMSDFSETEQAQLYFFVRGALQYAQAQWWLWRDGSLPNELWAFRSKWARNFVEAPLINEIWQPELNQHIFSARFVEDILGIDKQGELAIATAQK